MKNIAHKDIEQSKVFIDNEQTDIEIKQEYYLLLKKTVILCLKEEEIKVGCEINMLLTNDESIRQINAQFRDVNTPTDVLSFPMARIEKGEIFDEGSDYDIDEGLLMIGDIVISMETAQRQSEQYGHSFEREIAFLTAHGVFHLLGYDHENMQDETEMIEKQKAVLGKLGLKRA